MSGRIYTMLYRILPISCRYSVESILLPDGRESEVLVSCNWDRLLLVYTVRASKAV
jgi:hypothetical protein